MLTLFQLTHFAFFRASVVRFLAQRPKLVSISEEMKEWSALLGAEVASWPSITSRRMFGMTVFYCKGLVFAALPSTRAFATPNSIGFKLYKKTPQTLKRLAADPRISSRESAQWISRDVKDEKDLKNALEWLDLAYRMSRTK